MGRKVKATIKNTEEAIFDIGDLPLNLVRDLLVKNDGSFDGNWGLGDVGKSTWTTDSVEVVEVAK